MRRSSSAWWASGIAGLVMYPFAPAAAAQFWGGCVDALGRPVPDYPNLMLNDIARAFLGPMGEPVIEYNPQVVVSVSPATRRFFYLHECGHHALGQIISGQNIPFASEQAADCWAAEVLYRQNASIADIRSIQRDIAQSSGDWTHLPGPQRAMNLVACVQESNAASERYCEDVVEYEAQQVIETQPVPQQVPCGHCGCDPWMGCGCMHPYDVVTVPMQVPVVRQVPVTRRVCSP